MVNLMEIKVSILNTETKKMRYEYVTSLDPLYPFADLDDKIQKILLPNEWVSNTTFLTVFSVN